MLPAAEVVITTSSSKPPAKRVKIKESSLPDPFPLPSNYKLCIIKIILCEYNYACDYVPTESASKPPAKRFKIEDNIYSPILDPFFLPGNYRPDVQVALSSGIMTGITRAAFLTQVAGAIFNHKRYPTGPEFIRVASEIIRKYPFLGSTKECGSKTVTVTVVYLLLHAIITVILLQCHDNIGCNS